MENQLKPLEYRWKIWDLMEKLQSPLFLTHQVLSTIASLVKMNAAVELSEKTKTRDGLDMDFDSAHMLSNST